MLPITIIKNELVSKNADAWVVVDYENKNPTIASLFGDKMLTRKIIVVFEKNKSFIICHSIDTVFLNEETITSSFELKVYNTWQEMLDLERSAFAGYKKVLMDVSENGLLPRVSLADYGSVKFIESLGIEIGSSCDILQQINAQYDEESYQLQVKACELTLKIKDEAFQYIKEMVLNTGKANEYDVQQFICRRFHEEGMVYDEAPIVAIGPNASNPHYGPTSTTNSDINVGDLVLIDMWAKMNHQKAVYADITWMGYVGDKIPQDISKRFAVLRLAVDTGIEYLKKYISEKTIYGFEVDDVVRKVVNESGYGKYFTHRTGHNISVDETPHGPGANIDNFESHDERSIINGTSFSLEPGIYAPDFGMRSETNIAIHNCKVEVVAGIQDKVITILAK